MKPWHAVMVGADHPALEGHFPGNPLVPGVVLLSLAEAAARDLVGAQSRLLRVPAVKFLRPLRPDEPVDIHVEAAGADPATIRFTIERAASADVGTAGGDRTIATGTLTFAR